MKYLATLAFTFMTCIVIAFTQDIPYYGSISSYATSSCPDRTTFLQAPVRVTWLLVSECVPFGRQSDSTLVFNVYGQNICSVFQGSNCDAGELLGEAPYCLVGSQGMDTEVSVQCVQGEI